MITKRRLLIIIITYTTSFFFSVLIAMMFGYNNGVGYEPFPIMFFSSVVIFTLTFFCAGKFSDFWSFRVNKKELNSGLTRIFSMFADDVRKSYSIDEVVLSVQNILEKEGDCSVLLFDSNEDYVIYNSPSNITQDEKLYRSLTRNFARTQEDGYYFFDANLGLLTENDNARGFFIAFNNFRLFVFCNATRIIASDIFEILYDELKKFYTRYKTILGLTTIDELSQEWSMVAETQRAFLPPALPLIDKLDIAVHFKPLINVSGDYYTVIEISKTKSLVMIGDVSGKGFSAALIMGIVINIVKSINTKTDLKNLVRTIDKAIKAMHFEDKYTVLFVGIIDTEQMTLTYINASVADIYVLTQNPAGYKIKRINSNCSIIGLIDLGPLEEKTMPLFWNDVLFFATDGLCECVNSKGIELSCSENFDETIKTSANKTAEGFVKDIYDLALFHNSEKKFRDDITIMVIKVKK